VRRAQIPRLRSRLPQRRGAVKYRDGQRPIA